jgi:hypothetical protein
MIVWGEKFKTRYFKIQEQKSIIEGGYLIDKVWLENITLTCFDYIALANQ